MKLDSISLILAMTGATSLASSPEMGQITAINASRNYAGSLAQDVQGYIAGLPATDEEQLLDLLFPPVETNDFFQFAKSDDQYYLTEADDSDIRAIGASFKRIQHSGTIVTASTQQKGLTMRVDHKTLPKVNGTIVSGWENRYAAHLKARLIRAEIVRGLALLDAASTNTAKVWNAASNPDGDLRALAQRTRLATGRLPTHVVMASNAQQLRQDAYEASTRANHAMSNHAGYTLEQLANYASVGQIILEDGIKQTKKGAVKVDRLSNVVYSYNAEKNVMIDDPSNIKRAWNNTPFGGKWAVVIKEELQGVFTDITVFHESLIFVPITAGIEKLTVSAA